jgi:hypothetical protein
MKLYKLTNKTHQTYNNTQWGEGVTHETNGEGELCGAGWLHAYLDPYLAVLLNPIHGAIRNPVLWEAEGEGEFKSEHQLKVGVTKLTTIRQIPLPKITFEERIHFAILCVKKVYSDIAWNLWADKWLSGEDRSKNSASDAAYAAYAAYTASDASDASDAAYAAYTASDAAFAASDAAYAAYVAAYAAAFDLLEIVKEIWPE